MPTLSQQARQALSELETHPHKKFGQNFLTDPTVVSRMVQAATIQPTDTVLEIGPGLGVLSDLLAETAGRLYLVEVDPVLADRLRARFAQQESVHIVTADFLELDIAATFAESPIRVIASLPYNVATPMLFRLLEHRRQFPTATVMLQREVAERLSAKADTSEYGALSVMIQLYATVTKVATVQPGSFFPSPKVQSQIVNLVFQDTPRVDVREVAVFRRVVKAAFGQRRKTLRNALKVTGYGDLEGLSVRSGIDFQRRGETLSLEEFARLANMMEEEQGNIA
ncbi:MAG: 16S rRNA (adenine(1518)-N(6)/adenine(1519)-N(6))-dimethyltransferase RsmA [Deltaproteobacteria bacterium]|nr:16S rRNA (adenine(1518)-N(6)/adenine(1519)-N(6))-dimethyltransferase RsmA [Deltaproteobacteria bacterium]